MRLRLQKLSNMLQIISGETARKFKNIIFKRKPRKNHCGAYFFALNELFFAFHESWEYLGRTSLPVDYVLVFLQKSDYKKGPF